MGTMLLKRRARGAPVGQVQYFTLNQISTLTRFARLTKEEQMEQIRMKMLSEQYRSKGLESSETFAYDTFGDWEPMQFVRLDAMLRTMSKKILSENDNLQLHATTQIAKLFLNGRECPTTLFQNGVIQRFVHFLMRDDFSVLQCAAAWALIKIACKTFEAKEKFVRETVPGFVRLLDSPCDNLCEMAVFALGIVALDYREVVLKNRVLVPLLKLLEKHANSGNHANLSMLRNVTWTLSIFCEGISNRSYEQVKPALTTLGCLLHSDDLEVLIHSCWAIHGLAFGVFGKINALMDAGLCPKLVEHLIHSSRRVQIPVAMTVALIPFEMGQTHIQALIENGTLGHLLTLLTEGPKAEDPKGDRGIKGEACKVIYGILLGKECQIQAVIDAKLFSPLVKLLESPDEYLQELAALAISMVTSSGSRKQIEHLVSDCKIINPICNLLCRNQRAIATALRVLDDLLMAGSSKGYIGRNDVCRAPIPCAFPTPNHYAKLIVEAQCVEKLERITRGEEFDSEIATLADNIMGDLDELEAMCYLD